MLSPFYRKGSDKKGYIQLSLPSVIDEEMLKKSIPLYVYRVRYKHTTIFVHEFYVCDAIQVTLHNVFRLYDYQLY